MNGEPPVKRAVVFVDDQKLFHAAREAFGYTCPNYDVAALAEPCPNPAPGLSSSDVNTRPARLERVVALVPDVVCSTRTALRVLGDMAGTVDGLAVEMSAIRQRIADTEVLFRQTRDQILEGVHTLEIHLASIEEQLATLEDEL